MKIILDTAAQTLTTAEAAAETTLPLFSPASYEAISRQWIRVGWSLRCYHNFSWFGRPVLQLPEDLLRVQEAVYQVRPDVIIETGVFRGGSLLFYASLCQALGKGRVIGVDREIPPADREALQRHPLAHRITLIEGDSVCAQVVERVAGSLQPGDAVMVVLDSCHTRQHVRRELELYSPFVTPGSYIIAADGIIEDLADVPGGDPAWASDNPLVAANEFLMAHPEFERVSPPRPFRESDLCDVTYWPNGWLKRTK